jgi:deazaflavin-dependent oxidoreductase (nitroreductase family)
MPDVAKARYQAPDWFTKHVFNRLVRRATRLGLSVLGSRDLRIRGRKTGTVRSTVVNLLDHDGHRYLVAPRGETEWVRNLRAAGIGELRVGRRVEPFTYAEVADGDKVDILRIYLRRWKWEVGQFFQGVGPDAPADDLARIASGYPVFEILTAPSGNRRAGTASARD